MSDRHIELKNRGGLLEKILYQMDKRFGESRQDMNRRFKQVDERFEQLFWFISLFIPLSNTLVLLGLNYILK